MGRRNQYCAELSGHGPGAAPLLMGQETATSLTSLCTPSCSAQGFASIISHNHSKLGIIHRATRQLLVLDGDADSTTVWILSSHIGASKAQDHLLAGAFLAVLPIHVIASHCLGTQVHYLTLLSSRFLCEMG